MLFFDRSCLDTIEKSKLNIDSYFIVDSLEELKEKAINYDDLIQKQKHFAEYCSKTRDKTLYELKSIFDTF